MFYNIKSGDDNRVEIYDTTTKFLKRDFPLMIKHSLRLQKKKLYLMVS